jgi:hypothetical protein
VDFLKANWCLMRVQSWCHRCRVVLARGSKGWDALGEELSPGEWDLPSHAAPIRFAGSMGLKPAPASIPPIIHPPTASLNGPGEGLMFPTGAIRIQPTARPSPPLGA